MGIIYTRQEFESFRAGTDPRLVSEIDAHYDLSETRRKPELGEKFKFVFVIQNQHDYEEWKHWQMPKPDDRWGLGVWKSRMVRLGKKEPDIIKMLERNSVVVDVLISWEDWHPPRRSDSHD